uniref:Uncharacterized protein n=1 Tax=Panagrolaimus sp. PS1159 TaxID=55785 RepID=A0AC35F340_9BILA
MKYAFLLFIFLYLTKSFVSEEDEEDFDFSEVGIGTDEYDPDKFVSLILAQNRDPVKLLKLIRGLMKKGYFYDMVDVAMPLIIKCPSIQYEAVQVVSLYTESKADQIIEDAILYLIPLMSSKDSNIAKESLHAIANILAANPTLREFSLMNGIDKQLFKFINNPNTSIKVLREVASIFKSICLKENLADRYIDRILSAYDYFLTRHFDPEIFK